MQYKYIGNSPRRIGQYTVVKPGEIIELSEESANRLSGLLQRASAFGGKHVQGQNSGFTSKRVHIGNTKKENSNV